MDQSGTITAAVILFQFIFGIAWPITPGIYPSSFTDVRFWKKIQNWIIPEKQITKFQMGVFSVFSGMAVSRNISRRLGDEIEKVWPFYVWKANK